MSYKTLNSWLKEFKYKWLGLEKPFSNTSTNRCTKWLLLDGKYYGNKNYRGAILIESKKLIPWSLQILNGVTFYPISTEQAKLDFNSWLFGADGDDETVTILDSGLYSMLKHYVDNFARMNLVHCYCPDCKALHDSVIIKEIDIPDSVHRGQWHEVWCCPKHHIVFEEDQDIRVF
jgi:hypothetical protein